MEESINYSVSFRSHIHNNISIYFSFKVSTYFIIICSLIVSFNGYLGISLYFANLLNIFNKFNDFLKINRIHDILSFIIIIMQRYALYIMNFGLNMQR